ncbi:hypothetical protein TNCV_2287651 [Trichonephila clavipes]|nr:hypothetical protein TNCV_2287651 [Trichonephila clavipes]
MKIKYFPGSVRTSGARPFSKSRESVSDNPRSGRLATFVSDENIEKVRKLITKDRRLTVHMAVDELSSNSS